MSELRTIFKGQKELLVTTHCTRYFFAFLMVIHGYSITEFLKTGRWTELKNAETYYNLAVKMWERCTEAQKEDYRKRAKYYYSPRNLKTYAGDGSRRPLTVVEKVFRDNPSLHVG